MSALQVIAAGPLSTLQDLGRFGWQRFGVSTAGAFDQRYLRIANLLVGNEPGVAAIEQTLIGDRYEIEGDGVLAAFAGKFALKIDGEPAEAFRAYRLRAGQQLQIGAAQGEVRGYLAVAGGFALPPTLGSLSTHVRTGLGGLAGRALRAGDRLALQSAAVDPARPLWRLPPPEHQGGEVRLRVVLGPQDDHFSDRGLATFLGESYRISAEADRMGFRLSGPPIAHAKGYNIVSDGIPAGAVQVPGTGLPIVLGPDRQTTGGYPKIACVIGPDLDRLAQLRPGQELRFVALSPQEARAALLDYRRGLDALRQALLPAGPPVLDSETLLRSNLIDGVVDMTAPEWRGAER